MITHAMILAAGFGTRLKPLTDNIPKPLLKYKGKPMIENIIEKLTGCGIKNITVNTHYHSVMISEYFAGKKFNSVINIINEKKILGTGGGIKNASQYLKGSGNFLVHNVDVESDIDIPLLAEFHQKHNPLATLCVKKRSTARPLLIDIDNNLCGRIVNGEKQFSGNTQNAAETAFCGVYILSERVFGLFQRQDKFDIIPFFLDMAGKGEIIKCYDIGETSWKDLGKQADLNS